MKLFPLRVRSRHGTHDAIRGKLKFPVRTILRLGSATPTEKVFPLATRNGKKIVEVNTVAGVKVSSNKRLMKQAFDRAGISHAQWMNGEKGKDAVIAWARALEEGDWPVVAKHIYGSRGTGNYLLKNLDQLYGWLPGKDLNKYIFELYFSGVREYRLHVCETGCFYGIRKMLKKDTPDDDRWFRNDSNSVWIIDTNPNFDRPVNWQDIVSHCVKALKEEGLDVAAFDVRVQSAKDKNGNPREHPEFIILESNSAPSFGELTAKKYMEQIPKIIERKLQ